MKRYNFLIWAILLMTFQKGNAQNDWMLQEIYTDSCFPNFGMNMNQYSKSNQFFRKYTIINSNIPLYTESELGEATLGRVEKNAEFINGKINELNIAALAHRTQFFYKKKDGTDRVIVKFVNINVMNKDTTDNKVSTYYEMLYNESGQLTTWKSYDVEEQLDKDYGYVYDKNGFIHLVIDHLKNDDTVLRFDYIKTNPDILEIKKYSAGYTDSHPNSWLQILVEWGKKNEIQKIEKIQWHYNQKQPFVFQKYFYHQKGNLNRSITLSGNEITNANLMIAEFQSEKNVPFLITKTSYDYLYAKKKIKGYNPSIAQTIENNEYEEAEIFNKYPELKRILGISKSKTFYQIGTETIQYKD